MRLRSVHAREATAKENVIAAAAIVWAIARKDILLEYRNKDIVISVAGFGVLIVAFLAISVTLTPTTAQAVGPGILWVGIAFAGVIGLNRFIAQESENGTMEGLMLAPISRDLLFFGKSLGIFIFLAVAELVILPIFAIFFNLNIWHPGLVLICLLANLGFAGVGTLFATMASKVRSREIMLPLILLPVSVPILLAASGSTEAITRGTGWDGMRDWLGIAAAFDAIFFTASALLFHFALEE